MRSQEINELAKALSAAQGEFTAPHKDKIAKVRMKSGGEYTYTYSDLATVIETVRPVLAKHGLAVVQSLDANVLITTLIHSSGQWMESKIPLGDASDPQEMGKLITYARRYALCGILSIASEDDTDASDDQTVPLAPAPVAKAPGPVAAQGPAPAPIHHGMQAPSPKTQALNEKFAPKVPTPRRPSR